MIFSHRGTGTGYPPNTIESFEAALKAGADGFECDVRLTGDGNLVACHDGNLRSNGRKVSIGRSSLDQLAEAMAPRPALPTWDELLSYIAQVKVPVFVEVKNLSPQVVELIARDLARTQLWDYVSVVGFPVLIWNPLSAQKRYPKLQVLRIMLFPAASLVKLPGRGDGVMVGWQDSIPGSERLFRATLPSGRLSLLRERYAARGMRVVGGIINRHDGLSHFADSGIHDIVTDDVPGAVAFVRQRSGTTNLGEPR